MEAKAGQRREYLKQIKNISKEDLVYIDESGIDRTVIIPKNNRQRE